MQQLQKSSKKVDKNKSKLETDQLYLKKKNAHFEFEASNTRQRHWNKIK